MKKLFILFALLLFICSFSRKNITWVAIGDSITYLNEHTNETGNRITKGYMTRVVEKLPYINYINQGHNGWTSGGIAENLEKIAIPIAHGTQETVFSIDFHITRNLGESNHIIFLSLFF